MLLLSAQCPTAQENMSPAQHPKEKDPSLASRYSLEEFGVLYIYIYKCCTRGTCRQTSFPKAQQPQALVELMANPSQLGVPPLPGAVHAPGASLRSSVSAGTHQPLNAS